MTARLSREARLDFALLCLMSLLWSPAFFILKELRTCFSEVGVGLVRYTIVTIGLALLLRWPRFREALHVRMSIRPLDRLWAVGLGLCFSGPAYMVYYFGMANTVGAEATIIVTSAPLLLALAGAIFLRERLLPGQWLGLVIGFVGVYGVVTHQWAWVNPQNLQSPGNLLVLLGVLIETAGTVLAVPLVMRASGVAVIQYSMLGNALFFWVATLTMHRPVLIAPPDARHLWMLAYLTIVCGLALFSLWYWIMERLPIGFMGISLYVQAPAAALLGYVAFGQTLPAAALQGGALILISIWLSTRAGTDEIT